MLTARYLPVTHALTLILASFTRHANYAYAYMYDSRDAWKTSCTAGLLIDPDNNGVLSQDELADYLTLECSMDEREDGVACDDYDTFEGLPFLIQYNFALTTCANNVTDVTDSTYIETQKEGKIRYHGHHLISRAKTRQGGIRRRRLEEYPSVIMLNPDEYTASLCFPNATYVPGEEYGILIKKGVQKLVEDFCDGIFDSVVSNEIILLTGILAPSSEPSSHPSSKPSRNPTSTPSASPTVDFPSDVPTHNPTGDFPTMSPSVSASPTETPTISSPPTLSRHPTSTPSAWPSPQPSLSKVPLATPSFLPTMVKSNKPTKLSKFKHKSDSPSLTPSVSPSDAPTEFPTTAPTSVPSVSPTKIPSTAPSNLPTTVPSTNPTPKADLVADVTFFYLLRIQDYYPAVLVEENLNDRIVEILSDIVLADIDDRTNASRMFGPNHQHHKSNYSRALEEELRYFLGEIEMQSFTDVICPDAVDDTDDTTESCVVLTSNIQVYTNSISVVDEHLQNLLSSKMLPQSTEFQAELMGRDADNVPDLVSQYLGEGTFAGSDSTLMPFPEPRPAVPAIAEANGLSQTEIVVISFACALTVSLIFVSGTLWRRRKLQELQDDKVVGDEYLGEMEELGNSQKAEKDRGMYGDALSAIKDDPLSHLQGDANLNTNLANATASLSQSYDDQMEEAIQAGDWAKVQSVAKSMSNDDPVIAIEAYEVLKIDEEYSSSSSLSSDERRKAAKLDALIDRGDWDAIASLASYVTVSSKEKSIARSGNSSIGSRSTRSKLSQVSANATPLIINYDDDHSQDGQHSTTSSLSGDDQSRRSSGTGSVKSSSSRRSAKSFKAQVISLLQRGAPQEVGSAGEMIRAFENNEDELLDMLTEKVREKESFHSRVVELLEKSAPEEVDNADAMIEAFAGSEDELIEVLQSMHERKVAEKQRLASQNLAKSDAKIAAVQRRQQQELQLQQLQQFQTGGGVQGNFAHPSPQDSLTPQTPVTPQEPITPQEPMTPTLASPKPVIRTSSQKVDYSEDNLLPLASNDVEIDLNQAIDAGDWALVAARAASLANEEDDLSSNRYSNSTVSTIMDDDERLDSLHGMIDNED